MKKITRFLCTVTPRGIIVVNYERQGTMTA